jgi:hypothetical protein
VVRGGSIAAVGSLIGSRQSNGIPVGHRNRVTLHKVPALERYVLPSVLTQLPHRELLNDPWIMSRCCSHRHSKVAAVLGRETGVDEISL